MRGPLTTRVGRVTVDFYDQPGVISWSERTIADRARCRFVSFTGLHGVTLAEESPEFREALEAASLVVPDGMSMVLAARLKGHRGVARTAGPDFLEGFCDSTGSRYRHFFYGGGDGVAERLGTALAERHGIRVAGTYTPPFRPLAAHERQEVIRAINESGADILWVGLGTPKQELWTHEIMPELTVPIAATVGAAFDFSAGLKRRAPRWMGRAGLEWLFRMVSEPRRLAPRYFQGIPRFALLLARDMKGSAAE